MSQSLRVKRIKEIVFVLTVCCLLILCWTLYPSFRYEKASMDMTEIIYDKFTGVIYLKNSLNSEIEWIPTDHKNIMETKYYLAEKELEKAITEIRNETRQKPRNKVSFNKKIVIPASL
jgi:hypothetical protein